MNSRDLGIRVSILLCIVSGMLGCEDATTPSAPEVVSFTSIPCLDNAWVGIPPRIVNSQADYDSIIGGGWCPDTIINFSEYTLLGQNADGGGCVTPFYNITITRDHQRREVLFRVVVIEHGPCLRAWMAFKWVLIPKVADGYQVVFQRENVQDS
jgi:hypothetical protein